MRSFFKETRCGNAPLLLKTGKVVGKEAALINLGHAQAATACCHTPSQGAQHLHRGDNANGIRTGA